MSLGSSPHIIIVAGPTASGKSDCAESIARQYNGEIINADSVQMVEKLSVGTAKPDWKKSDIPHHLFDICTEPYDYDVASYVQAVSTSVTDIISRGKQPVLVGGSLFYIKSLFYPPLHHQKTITRVDATTLTSMTNQEAWQKLKSVDSIRAAALHPNDRYRVDRALLLWEKHGIPPSQLKPTYRPMFHAKICFLSPDRSVLYQRINARTEKMIHQQGWINEARSVYADPVWRSYILQKKFIGYPEIFSWIEQGQDSAQVPKLIEVIQQATRRYARRQKTFWQKLCKQIGQEDKRSKNVSIYTITSKEVFLEVKSVLDS